MKKLCLILALLVSVSFSMPAFAKDLTLGWTQVISADFGGWRLYQSTTMGGPYELVNGIEYDGIPSSEYTMDMEIPEVVGDPVNYYFVVTAFDTSGNESVNSNEAVYTATDETPPGEPQTLTITIKLL